MAFISRFSTTQRGAVTVTGNTLGLSGNLTNPPPLPAGVPAGPAAVDTIGAFISTNPALQVPGGWPPGTTLNWSQNSSAAQLNIPPGSTVLYAELIWSGISINADQNVTAFLNNAVNFTTPLGTIPVSPDPATATQFSAGGSGNTAYVRSQDVTALVQAGGSGTYTLGSVPGALGNSVNNPPPTNVTPQNYLAWTLEVVYANPTLPVRNMTVWVNDSLINAASPPLDITVTGFQTPAAGPLNGKLFFSSVEGDANIVGDQAFFGPNAGSLTALGNPVTTPNPNPGTSPNNPINNFFGSQINGENGLLDTSGTFGTSNQDAFQGINFPAARQGLDIAAINLTSPLLQNSQTSAVIRLSTVGDSYGNIGGALQINGIEPIFAPIKTVDKAIAEVGDTLTYTITFTNNGTGNADNLVFTDIPPTGSSFIPGTVIVDGNPQPLDDPTAGISIGTVIVGQTVTISYQVTIDFLPPTPPTPPQLINDSVIDYDFQPVAGTILTGTNTSTQAITEVKEATLDIIKSVDKSFAKIGDILTYTIVVNNTGTVDSDNTTITDLIPSGTTFVANSVTVNGAPQPGENPSLGVNIGTVTAGGSATLTFQVTVDTIPTPNPIPNTADVIGSFIIDPAQSPVQKNFTSNQVTTLVNTAIINEVKTVDKSFAGIGDIITYTIALTNTGNVSADNVIFTDSIPNGTTFVANSVTINGIPQPGENPASGINLGSIAVGVTTTITFQLQVDTIPIPNPIPNSSSTSFQFVVDPNTAPENGTSTSNTVTTQVNEANITAVKTVDLQFANIGDTLTYSVTLTNTGNTSANNVIFTDIIPNDTTFVINSVTVGGIPQIGANPQTGINVGTIGAGASVIITFKVTVDTIPTPNPIPNLANIDYQFIVDPNDPPIDRTTTSNTVTTQVNNADITAIKTVDTTFANVGDVLTYTVILNNIGNVSADNIIFTDAIPSGTTLVANSVSVDGIPQIGADPSLGINIGSIAPSAFKIVTFQVTVDVIPIPNPIPNSADIDYQFTVDPNQPPVNESLTTNTVTTQVNNANLNAVKVVDKQIADVGDILTYTVTLTNTGNVSADNVIFTDSIPNGTTFVTNSVTVGGVTQIGANPESGINIGSIAAGSSIIITFKVIIDTIPIPNPIPNFANIDYEFIVDPNEPPIDENTATNTVTTQINNANIVAVKAVDKAFADVGDIINYTVTLTNTGNVNANSVIFKDPLPLGTSFVIGSVIVNGIPQPGADPVAGINVGTITPGGISTITFQIQVNAIPVPNPITNTVTANYSYIVDPNEPAVNKTTDSNTVTTEVKNASLSAIKTVDKQFANIGDTITYTVTLTNNGNTTADNVIFTDIIPNGTSFVIDSLTVGGVPQIGANPETGVNIGSIAPGASVIITFKIIVDAIPTPNPIPNLANIDYEYTVTPGQPPATDSVTSNTVTTQVNNATIEAVKAVDKAFANVGDTITYTVTLTNNGNTSADNVIFTDTIPNGTSFVIDSLIVGGVPQIGANPETGVNIGSIGVGASVVITFEVIVDVIPIPNPIPNSADIDYQFIVDPNEPPVNENTISNTVTTQVNNANIEAIKSVDKQFADINDTITYSVTLTNTGNVTANNVIFTDAIPNGTSFVIDSVTVGGVTQIGANPESGINIGSIAAGSSIIITFKVIIDTIPIPNPIPNFANVDYQFIVDPNEPPVNENTTSNTVTTQVNNADIEAVKSVDKQFADIGDTITYSVTLTNTGNVSADNVIFTDTIPNGTSFVINSVTVGGVTQIGANPETGVNIGSIAAGSSIIVTFEIIVDALPIPNPIPNLADINFEYFIDPNQPPANKNVTSNVVDTQVNNATLNIVKNVDKQFATIGEVLSYSFNIENTGNVLATNVLFKDIIPNGTEFVPNSFSINGTLQPGSNPSIGVILPNISPGEIIKVAFDVIVTSIPIPNPIENAAIIEFKHIVDPNEPPVDKTIESNKVATKIVIGQLDVKKIVTKSVVLVGDTLSYVVTITNSGNVNADNVVFKDTIPPDTSFITDSVLIDGVPSLGTNPETGISLGTIVPNATVTVSFSVKVESRPIPPIIKNSALVDFEFVVDPLNPPVKKSTISNEVITEVEVLNIEVIKTVDSTNALVGDILTYTITITNTGTITAKNVIFKDDIPEGTSYVQGSLKPINGDPTIGVNIGDILPGDSIIVSFKVTVDFVPCSFQIINKATVSFEYEIDGSILTETISSNSVSTPAGPRPFKQLSVDGYLKIPSQKPDAEDILSTIVDVEILNSHIIKTIKSKSLEGQNLTGNKLIIEGLLKQKVEYISIDKTQSVHSAEFNTPFSTFIVLPKTFEDGYNIEIDAVIEDIYTKLIDNRTIFKNITLMLKAKIS